jgi:hypothetical protein
MSKSKSKTKRSSSAESKAKASKMYSKRDLAPPEYSQAFEGLLSSNVHDMFDLIAEHGDRLLELADYIKATLEKLNKTIDMTLLMDAAAVRAEDRERDFVATLAHVCIKYHGSVPASLRPVVNELWPDGSPVHDCLYDDYVPEKPKAERGHPALDVAEARRRPPIDCGEVSVIPDSPPRRAKKAKRSKPKAKSRARGK